MTQYLIRSIEHNGETFTDVITVRDNEKFQVVEADSKEEAKENVNKDNSWFEVGDVIFIIMLAGWALAAIIRYLL